MVALPNKIRESENPQYDLPQSEMAEDVKEEAKYEADANYLIELVIEAVDFILEGIDDTEQLRDKYEKDDFSVDFIRSALETQAKEEYDPEIRAIFEEAAAKVRFLADYFEFQIDKGLKGDVRTFVRENKRTYKNPGPVNKLVLEMFGCQFNTLTNTLTQPRKNLNLSDEEIETWERVRRGDIHAINSIVVPNLPLVTKIIAQLYGEYAKNDDFNYQDLFHEGVLGLRKAVTRYNPMFGNQFSTMAYQWIRCFVSSYINKRLKHLYPNGGGLLHLDAPIDDDESKSLHAVVGEESRHFEQLEDKEASEALLSAIKKHVYTVDFAEFGIRSLAPDLAFHIVKSYFFDENGGTLKEVADTWEPCARTGKPYSGERIRQFKKCILESFETNPEIVKLLREAA